MTQLHTTWGWLVAMDLFLGGLGAGTFVAVAIIGVATGERFKATVRFGAWASVIAVALAPFCLLLEVGKPFRALVLFRSFVNPGSWMTIGAWLLISAVVINGLWALFWSDRVLVWFERVWRPLKARRTSWRIILAAIGILVNLGVAIYTGILLSVLAFRPLWHTWLLPVLFTAFALYTGVGLVAGYVAARERGQGGDRLQMALALGIIVLALLCGGVVGLYLYTMLSGPADAVRSAEILATGALGGVFWALVAGLGLAVPFLAYLAQAAGLLKRVEWAPVAVPVAATALLLIGGWTLRYLVLLAGLPQMLSSPVIQQIQVGVRFIP
jgi:formate-dependent nitrite reductase membrane component NrfD